MGVKGSPNRARWRPEEDDALLRHAAHGHLRPLVQKHLPGRTYDASRERLRWLRRNKPELVDRLRGAALVPGERLAEYRAALGLSRDDLARRMGYSESTLRQWEKGKGAVPPETAERLERLVRIVAPLRARIEQAYRDHHLQEHSR